MERRKQAETASVQVNRQGLWVAIAPFIIVGTIALCSFVQRSAEAARPGKIVGAISRNEAEKIGTAFCKEFLGTDSVNALDTSAQTAFSDRRKTTVNEWDVICDTPLGQYLVRINGDSRRVFAVNRVSDPEGEPLWSSEVQPTTEGILTRQQAEKRAQYYLALLGVSANELKTIRPATVSQMEKGSVWNFTYRHRVPGHGIRLLKVTINSSTGSLENVWNPVYAL